MLSEYLELVVSAIFIRTLLPNKISLKSGGIVNVIILVSYYLPRQTIMKCV